MKTCARRSSRQKRGRALAAVMVAAVAAAGCGGGTESPHAVRVVVTAPTDGTYVTVPKIKVFGTVTPASASVDVGGRQAPVRNGVFIRWMSLRVGLSHIKIVATAAGYASADVNIAVRRYASSPSSRAESSAPAYTGPRTEGTDGARVISFTIASHRMGRRLNEVAVIPAGESKRPRPLLVLLHELVGTPGSTVTEAVLAALARLGPAAPDIVSPYSPADSYWHDRAGRAPNYLTRGAWGSYVADEVIPRAITLLHADPRRIAIAGNSMGGFGALDIARLHPGVFCAVAAHSPALFSSYSSSTPISSTESAPANFDNAADFARHDLLRAAATSPNLYGNAQVWIDAGNRDQHVAADRTLAHLLKTHGTHVQSHVWPGEHDNAYWNLHQEDYFHFYETALAHCVT